MEDLKERIPGLYHFTDARNLESIKKEGGLYPLRTLQYYEIPIARPGGNELSRQLDRERNLDRYVHLTLTTEHPMAHRAQQDGRIEDIQWLTIDKRVLDEPGVLFSKGVANSKSAEILPLDEAYDAIDTASLRAEYVDWDDPEIKARTMQARKSEILVPEHVPIHLIKRA